MSPIINGGFLCLTLFKIYDIIYLKLKNLKEMNRMKIREMIRVLEKIEREYGSEIDVKGFDTDEFGHYNVENVTFDGDFRNVVYVEMVPEGD